MIINMNGAKAPETPSPVLQEKTVTPETLPTVIGADEGYDGLSQVTVNPDAQLKAENIRSGKTIFGVAGAFTGETQTVYETVDTVRYALENRQALTGDFYTQHVERSGVSVTETKNQSFHYWNSSLPGTRFMHKGKFTYIPGNYYSPTSYYTGNGSKWTITADSFTLNGLEIFSYVDNDVSYPSGTPVNITLTGYANGSTSAEYAKGREKGFDLVTHTTTGTLEYGASTSGSSQLYFNFNTPLVLNNLNFNYYTLTGPSTVSLVFTVQTLKADVIE